MKTPDHQHISVWNAFIGWVNWRITDSAPRKRENQTTTDSCAVHRNNLQVGGENWHLPSHWKPERISPAITTTVTLARATCAGTPHHCSDTEATDCVQVSVLRTGLRMPVRCLQSDYWRETALRAREGLSVLWNQDFRNHFCPLRNILVHFSPELQSLPPEKYLQPLGTRCCYEVILIFPVIIIISCWGWVLWVLFTFQCYAKHTIIPIFR